MDIYIIFIFTNKFDDDILLDDLQDSGDSDIMRQFDSYDNKNTIYKCIQTVLERLQPNDDIDSNSENNNRYLTC